MAGVLDTNLLLYAANRDAAEHRAARAFVQEALSSTDTWYLTEGIVYEFLRVATHARVFSQPLDWAQAVAFLDVLLGHPRIGLLVAGSHHWGCLKALLPHLTHPMGNLFFDIRTVVLMREHGVRQIFTTDTDFLQFPDLTVINPLLPSSRSPSRRRS